VLLSMLLIACPFMAETAIAKSRPRLRHSLTINLTPCEVKSGNSCEVTAGDHVRISGLLSGRYHGRRTILVYQRSNPDGSFDVVGKTATASDGIFKFDTVASTNGSWFVQAPGVAGAVRSPVVEQQVAAALSMSAHPTRTDTRHPILFTGSISPVDVHVGERVYLQRAEKSGLWNTIETGTVDGSSHFSISHHFVVRAPAALRVVFLGDDRNLGAVSNEVIVRVKQAQTESLTIESSRQLITYGQSATISGVLKGGSNVSVTLFGRQFGTSRMVALDQTVTAGNGSYRFAVAPAHAIEYEVRGPDGARSYDLFEGVRDSVSLRGPTSATLDRLVVLKGNVAPDKGGHRIDLQMLGSDGQFHTVASTTIGTATSNHTSAYRLRWRPDGIGVVTLRTRVAGDTTNLSGVSPSLVVTIAQR
jgi:hypothetical protein